MTGEFKPRKVKENLWKVGRYNTYLLNLGIIHISVWWKDSKGFTATYGNFSLRNQIDDLLPTKKAAMKNTKKRLLEALVLLEKAEKEVENDTNNNR